MVNGHDRDESRQMTVVTVSLLVGNAAGSISGVYCGTGTRIGTLDGFEEFGSESVEITRMELISSRVDRIRC